MAMKFSWKGNWRKGEITIEAETFQELDDAIKSLLSKGEIEETSEVDRLPEIPPVQSCPDAIRAIMKTGWGKQLRSMNEIKRVLDANALYFSKGTLPGALTTMTKKGELQRVKEEGKWKYSLK